MTEQTRTVSPWLAGLEAIQQQMEGVSDDEILAALQANETDETVGTATVLQRHEETRG